MKIHRLKCHIPYYAECVILRKTFEIRKNDRDFKVNDILFLKEYDQRKKKLTGFCTSFTITYVFKPTVRFIATISLDACVMSIIPTNEIKTANFHLYTDKGELERFNCKNEDRHIKDIVSI